MTCHAAASTRGASKSAANAGPCAIRAGTWAGALLLGLGGPFEPAAERVERGRIEHSRKHREPGLVELGALGR